MCQFDCGWYWRIIEKGYDLVPRYLDNCCWQANWAFFPLYPLVVRGISHLGGFDPNLIGIMVSSACCIGFIVLGALHRRETRGDATAWPWALLVICWPYSFYFHAMYSEAMYAALAMAALLAVERRHMGMAGSMTALLTATRPTGMVMAAWIGLVQARALYRARSLADTIRIAIPVAIAPLGLFAFMAYLHWKVGDALAFQRIQEGWGRTAANPWTTFWQPYYAALEGVLDYERIYFSVWAVLGIIATLFLAHRRRFAEAWFCGVPILMGLGSGHLLSMPRFVACNPAFLLAAADVVSAVRSPWLRAIILAVMAALQAVAVLYWWRASTVLI
jgi:hypothetical protein